MTTRGDGVARRVACPRCGAPALYAPGNRFRPFCSERCAGIDLGAWASEAYRVAAEPPEGDEPAPDSPHALKGVKPSL